MCFWIVMNTIIYKTHFTVNGGSWPIIFWYSFYLPFDIHRDCFTITQVGNKFSVFHYHSPHPQAIYYKFLVITSSQLHFPKSIICSHLFDIYQSKNDVCIFNHISCSDRKRNKRTSMKLSLLPTEYRAQHFVLSRR